MLYTYVLKIEYVRHFKTKVESQGVIRCRHEGHILNQVRVFVCCGYGVYGNIRGLTSEKLYI